MGAATAASDGSERCRHGDGERQGGSQEVHARILSVPYRGASRAYACHEQLTWARPSRDNAAVRPILTVATVALLGGCSAAPVELALSDVVLRVEPADGRVRASRLDGRVIFDSLAGGDVDAGAAPHVGFAFENVAPEWSELYGAFRVDDATPAWQGVRHFHDVTKLADGISFAIDGPAGGGHGLIRRVADGTLALEVVAPALTRSSAAFRCAPDERFLGFGAMPTDVEHRGQTVPIWVGEQGIDKRRHATTIRPTGSCAARAIRRYLPVPFFVSSRGFGVRADSYGRSRLRHVQRAPTTPGASRRGRAR